MLNFKELWEELKPALAALSIIIACFVTLFTIARMVYISERNASLTRHENYKAYERSVCNFFVNREPTTFHDYTLKNNTNCGGGGNKMKNELSPASELIKASEQLLSVLDKRVPEAVKTFEYLQLKSVLAKAKGNHEK